MPKFCTFCGSELEPEMQFCAKCGGKVEKETPKESASPSQTAFAQPSPTIAPSSVPPPPVMPSTPTMPISPRPYPVGGSSTPLHLPENTKLADDGDRFLAYIIDGMIIGAIASSLQGLIYGWHGFNPMNFVWSNESYVSYGLSLLYYWGFEFLTKGRTLGKMAMHLRTVDEATFQPVNAFRYLLHSIGKVFLVPLDFIIGSIARDKSNPVYKSQVRITQRLSKTVVLKELRPIP
jgi:uncharacterized RDD family membrane protein YckC